MSHPLIPCVCCGGTGKIELHAEYGRTLQLIREAFGPISTSCLAEEPLTANAIAMRCLRLESMGLIKRAGKEGKFILWEAVNP